VCPLQVCTAERRVGGGGGRHDLHGAPNPRRRCPAGQATLTLTLTIFLPQPCFYSKLKEGKGCTCLFAVVNQHAGVSAEVLASSPGPPAPERA